MAGPLHGLRIIELSGIGPGPFAGMLLSDMGAEVIQVDRPGGNPAAFAGHTTLWRGRRNIAVNLKDPEGVTVVRQLAATADALFEGYRPGVAERLGIGPDTLLELNPRLVYGRMTGWGQDGPLALAAGHDINYIALSGALHAMGPAGHKPTVPLNLVGDFGGGGMFLAFGMVCAMLEAQRTGRGQVVDAAMVDGAATLMQMFFSMRAEGVFSDQAGSNMLDGGAPFYDTYATADGRHVAIGALEPQFYAELRSRLELDDPVFDEQLNTDGWPQMRQRLTERIGSLTLAELNERLEGSDACYAPILDIGEVPDHPHAKARDAFVKIAGVVQPAPAPRFSVTVPDPPTAARAPGTDTTQVLSEAGFDDAQIAALLERGAVAQI